MGLDHHVFPGHTSSSTHHSLIDDGSNAEKNSESMSGTLTSGGKLRHNAGSDPCMLVWKRSNFSGCNFA